MRAEQTITTGQVLDIIERLKKQERGYCEDFCKKNSGAVNDARRHDSVLILSALNTILYEIGRLNG